LEARNKAWVDENAIFTFGKLGELEEKCLGLIEKRLGLPRILKKEFEKWKGVPKISEEVPVMEKMKAIQ